MSDVAAAAQEEAAFVNAPDPENPGWHRWDLKDTRRFNAQVMGKLITRVEANGAVRLRMFPELKHTNLLDIIHGATTLSLIDISLFACGHMLGLKGMEGSVTLDLSTQFIGGGYPDRPMDAVAEVLKETNRLVFLRGIVEQGEHKVAAFAATIRKGRSQ
ncbi:MAG: PaaI family thioesterase [Sphingomonadaceae bacterium]|jgi:acyl-coenzyme A thioesterase PaaI-like protein|nr:PaaI family thioesterase [Sphingomonadaceae bacterium]NBU78214.1 PaaI family thioesterase [Sphingomonadaceae bacterium]NCA00908.1 PaaI family thioesterase [Sphingomonadaceae bacterium]